MVKSAVLIGRNYLFNYTAQSNYCTIEIFNHSCLKNNIDKKKDSRKFEKAIKENLWEFHEAWKYVHQILLIVDKASRYVEDQISTNFHVISTNFFDVISLIEKSMSVPHTFFNLISMFEKPVVFHVFFSL